MQVLRRLRGFQWRDLNDCSWEAARDKILQVASGSGAQAFLVDKMLVNLVLYGVLRLRATAPGLGPGALATLHVVKHYLIDRGEWRHTFSMDPKAVPTWARKDLGDFHEMDHNSFLRLVVNEVHRAGRLYLEHRVAAFPELRDASVYVSKFLDDYGAQIEAENILCEIGRRRACALHKSMCLATGLKPGRLGKGNINPSLLSETACARRSVSCMSRIVEVLGVQQRDRPFPKVV